MSLRTFSANLGQLSALFNCHARRKCGRNMWSYWCGEFNNVTSWKDSCTVTSNLISAASERIVRVNLLYTASFSITHRNICESDSSKWSCSEVPSILPLVVSQDSFSFGLVWNYIDGWRKPSCTVISVLNFGFRKTDYYVLRSALPWVSTHYVQVKVRF